MVGIKWEGMCDQKPYSYFLPLTYSSGLAGYSSDKEKAVVFMGSVSIDFESDQDFTRLYFLSEDCQVKSSESIM